MVSRNSIPGGFAYIWQSKWLGIIAIKTESIQINFLSEVLVAVASLDLKVPINQSATPYSFETEDANEKHIQSTTKLTKLFLYNVLYNVS